MSRSAVSNIIFMINKLDLLWVPTFIALRIYFIFRSKFSWNEGFDTCFNVECVLLGRNFDLLEGYLVVTARYLVVTAAYCLLLDGYWWLLLLTGSYCLFFRLVWTPSNRILAFFLEYHNLKNLRKPMTCFEGKVPALT